MQHARKTCESFAPYSLVSWNERDAQKKTKKNSLVMNYLNCRQRAGQRRPEKQVVLVYRE